MKQLYMFLFCSLLGSSISISQTFWQRLNGIIAGNTIQCIAIDNSAGIVYAGAGTGGGLYKSTNNGDDWTMVYNGIPANKSVWALAVNGGSVYAVVDKLFLSTNTGDSWSELSNSPTGSACITIASNGNLYVGSSNQGVNRSTDGGASWTQISNGLPFYTVYIYTYYRDIKSIAVCPDGTLLCATDGGSSS